MKKLSRLLVVGYGSMGRRRIRLASELIPNAEYICVDNNPERQKQAKEAGYIAITSLEEGIAMKPDAAFVCTSPGHHAELILELLNAGIHVFTELNLTADCYDEIMKTAKEKHAVIFASSTLVYKKQMEMFCDMVSKQTKPVSYTYHVGQYLPDWHPWESYKDFFVGKKETNGVREIMAIQLPWMIRTFGPIKNVSVSNQRCTDLEIDFPDSVILKIEHESGHIGTFTVDVTARKAVTKLEIIGEDIHVFWDGHNDDLFRLNLDTKELEQLNVYESEEHVEGYSDNIAEEPYRDEIQEFLRAIDGNPVRYTLEDDAYVLRLIDRIESMYQDGDKDFHLDSFINTYVTKRPGSMFEPDIQANREELTRAICGKSVLVIGGAGSIGSSFIRAIIPFRPAELVVVDTNENALTELTRSLRSSAVLSPCVPEVYLPYPMDYSSITFRRMFIHHKRTNGMRGFDIVANFSAHKHVRSEKDIYSVEALLRNNVINAKGLLDLLEENPPETYFCVSTDKAANPVNIMGASKRVMEDLIFSYSNSFPVKTARFANVAFSNGSLPAGFIERINRRQPLSAPSDVKRYFVSPEESGQICMLSAMLGANRAIFFPKLEEAQMTTFDRIAEDLLTEMGYQIDYCASDEEAIEKAAHWKAGQAYPVHFSPADTSGEKAFEEFYVEGETVDMNRFGSLGVITDKIVPNRGAVIDLIRSLDDAFESENCIKADIVKIIGSYLPNFSHIETGKSLDGKM
ncbi:MAG: hypothetical protein E7254_12455 [Lachnospiraceae bacterium]|nr:hypothetical protein [Lachnospiraceae bacterium]